MRRRTDRLEILEVRAGLNHSVRMLVEERRETRNPLIVRVAATLEQLASQETPNVIRLVELLLKLKY